jgi:hypothetical protein
MAKMIGLSRAIKTEWLTKTVELVTQTTNESEIKEKLNEYLSFEISSPTNLRKTREILLNIWYRPSITVPEIWKEAVKAYQHDANNRFALNWAMILLAYPVFSDICSLIGKISAIQDTFTTAWLKEKLLSIWGERSTIYHSSNKILQTLKSIGAIENVKVGSYKICSQKITDTDTIKVLLMVLLALNKKAYYEIPELSRVTLYFPLIYEVSPEWLYRMSEINIGNFGGKTVVSAKEYVS